MLESKLRYCLRFFAIFLFLAAVISLTGLNTASAQEKLPYLIKVNRACNTITVYEQDITGDYSKPVKSMLCSVGTLGRTRKGTFQTQEKYRWKALMGGVWGQYATRIVGGILFHSVYYYENGNPATLAIREYNKLGKAASHGCIRLTVEDSKWLYDNCAAGTTVIIYDDEDNPGPLGKPELIKLSLSAHWDPTDPDKRNPYLASNKSPVISGAEDIVTAWCTKVDLRKGVTAKASDGTDITDKISVKGKVQYDKPGNYKVTYSVKDKAGRTAIKKINITVDELTAPLEFTGIHNRVVNEKETIDKTFVLKGVKAYYAKKKLESKLIDVIIQNNSEDEYTVTYLINVDGKAAAYSQAIFHIDREAPQFQGITDIQMEYGEIPTKSFVLQGVTVSDNYSAPENIEIYVNFYEDSDGTYKVTYKAVDEAGNSSKEICKIYN